MGCWQQYVPRKFLLEHVHLLKLCIYFRGLLILLNFPLQERANLQLTSDLLAKWLEQRIDSAPLLSHATSTTPFLPPTAPPQGVRSCPQLPQTPSTSVAIIAMAAATPLSENNSAQTMVAPSSGTALLPQTASTPLLPATGHTSLTSSDRTPDPDATQQGSSTLQTTPGAGGSGAPEDKEERTDMRGEGTASAATVSAADSQMGESCGGGGEGVLKSKPGCCITALSVFTVNSAPNSSPFFSSSTTTTASSSSSDPAPCTLLVTGVTVSHPRTGNPTPTLLVHHVKVKSRFGGKHKGHAPSSSSTFTAPFGQSPADFLDMADPITNPIPLSTGSNESQASVEIVGGVPLYECACDADDSEGVGRGVPRPLLLPEVRQIVPLAGGTLLAVTCGHVTVEDWSDECSVLLLFRVSPAGKLEALNVSSVFLPSPECHICPVIDAAYAATPLLACVGSSLGEAWLYGCTGGKLERVGVSRFGGSGDGDKGDKVSSCVYCPNTCRLFVARENGKVLSLKLPDLKEVSTVGISTSEVLENSRLLDSSELDNLLSLVTVSPLGLPFTCSSSVHWKEISQLWYNRRSPLHMNVAPEYADRKSHHAHRKGNMDNCRILQYEPTPESISDR